MGLLLVFVIWFLILDPILEYAYFHNDTEISKERRVQKYEDLQWYPKWKRRFFVGIPVLLFGLATIFIVGWSVGYVRKNSVFFAEYGPGIRRPQHYLQIKRGIFTYIDVVLSEGVLLLASFPERAIKLFTKGERRARELDSSAPGLVLTAPIPTFQDVLSQNMIIPGNPLILGFNEQGEPEYRSLETIIALAIAGWQGSGKTMTEAYLVAMLALMRAEIHIHDPHWSAQGSLTHLLQPLIQARCVTEWRPMAIRSMLNHFNDRLDARLAGTESSDRPFVIIVDELNRLTRIAPIFEDLVRFLERCTEEIRKANILFFGSGHKWSAKHFKGRADIRSCFPSFLIHKMKPSQADLFLEDVQNRKMVKHLHQPGEGILCTNYGDPVKISVPLVTHHDMQEVINRLSSTGQLSQKSCQLPKQQIPEKTTIPEGLTGQLMENLLMDRDLLDAVKCRLDHEGILQKDLCDQYNLDPGYLSKLLRGDRKKLSPNYRQSLQRFLTQKP